MYKIHDFIGIPYKDYGRSFNGCDCYGLVYLFYNYFLNINIDDYLIYDHSNKKEIESIINKLKLKWEKVNKPSLYDCILFKIEGRVSHIGIYVGNKRFLHNASFRKMSCIERLDHPFWKQRIEGYYAYVNC